MIALAAGSCSTCRSCCSDSCPTTPSAFQQDLADSEEVTRALDLGGLVNDENAELDECTNGAVRARVVRYRARRSGASSSGSTPTTGHRRPRRPARPGRARRLLGVLVHQLPALASRTSSPGTTRTATPGLAVIGIHSPEYAFEKEPRNVEAGIRLHSASTTPSALDNSLSTWTNYRNRYWPAHYLIDAEGTVRHISFGEGNYAATEQLIRELLERRRPRRRAAAPRPSSGDETPEPVRPRPRRSSARRSR